MSDKNAVQLDSNENHKSDDRDLKINLLSLSDGLKRIDQNSAPSEELASTKLNRSSALIYHGINDGALGRLQDVAYDHPLKGAAIMAASGAIGYGLMALHNAGGRYARAAEIANGVLTLGVVADGLNRGVEFGKAVADNWKDGANFEKNKDAVGNSIGSMFVDYGMLMAGGKLGMMTERAVPKIAETYRDWGNPPSHYTPVAIEPGSLLSSPGDRLMNFFNHYRYGQNKIEPYKSSPAAEMTNLAEPGFRIDSSSFGKGYTNAYWSGKEMVYGDGTPLKLNLDATFRHDLSLSNLQSARLTQEAYAVAPYIPLSLLPDMKH